jgi:hypothetical protein
VGATELRIAVWVRLQVLMADAVLLTMWGWGGIPERQRAV